MGFVFMIKARDVVIVAATMGIMMIVYAVRYHPPPQPGCKSHGYSGYSITVMNHKRKVFSFKCVKQLTNSSIKHIVIETKGV